MDEPWKKNSRLLSTTIIGVSMIGMFYFGFRAVWENSGKPGENPFEYSVAPFQKISPSLLQYSETGTIPLDLHSVYGVAADSSDNIYVTGDDRVLIMTPAGKTISVIALDGPARCIDVDTNGDLYLGMDSRIEVYGRNGSQKARWKVPGENILLTSIAVADDYVYAADAGNRILRKFDKAGSETLLIGGKDERRDIPGCIVPGRFFDVDIDPDGFIWLVNPGRHALENYTPEGDPRTSWGVFSMNIDGFCGCCNPSHIVILWDGKFVTSEKGIPRIKVYDRLGVLESVVAGPGRFDEGTEGLDLAADKKGRIYVLDPMRRLLRIFEKKTPGV